MMNNNPLPRLDEHPEIREALLPFCRLKAGEIWRDERAGHRVGCLDAAATNRIASLMGGETAVLAVHDPPYNLVAFNEQPLQHYIHWCDQWVRNTVKVLSTDSSLYVWLGADQNDGFQPLADFMIMMRGQQCRSRSFITMRNQRGYGTQKNWMAVRQELLYYVKGDPTFNVEAEYTDIPKILRGYYKEVNGRTTENLERGKSDTIRAGNVWVDIQQVFYRMEENVSGCYAQKPLKAIERIVRASSNPTDLIIDFFSTPGTTLLAAEINRRRCFTIDTDPVFCEISIRRLEHFRRTGKLGWQNGHPFRRKIPPRLDNATGSVQNHRISERPRTTISLLGTIMEKLQQELDRLLNQLADVSQFRARLETLVSVYPFNDYEYIIARLTTAGILTHDEYIELRDAYIARNMFLYIFEIGAPRGFGETWAQGHLKGLIPELEKPTKKLDPSCSGEYDFLLDGNIKLEVKASRAVDFDSNEPLYVKALPSDSQKRFDMNFQQVKSACCDVFIWVGVWRDVIRYWVLASREMQANRYYSAGQHRGNQGEGQLHLKDDNIGEFSKYEIKSDRLRLAIHNAFKRQKNQG